MVVKRNERHTSKKKRGWKDAYLRFRLLASLSCFSFIRVSAVRLRRGRTTACPEARTCASVGSSRACIIGVCRRLRTHSCDFPSPQASPQPRCCFLAYTRECARQCRGCFLYSSTAAARCTPLCSCKGSRSILLRHTSSGSLCGAALLSSLFSFRPAGSARL